MLHSSYYFAIALISLLNIQAGPSTAEILRQEIVQDIENTLLYPALQGLLPELVGKWKSAVAAHPSDEDLLKIANAIAADYSKWDEQRELAVASVINHLDLGPYMTSHVDLGALGALCSVSKKFSLLANKILTSLYIQGNRVNWINLIQDIIKCNSGQRVPLMNFVQKLWPKSDDRLISALLARALCIFKQYSVDPHQEKPWLPYIPGQLRLLQALSTSGVIGFFSFTADAYFYEEEDIIREYPLRDCNPADVKYILSSGNEKAISNYCLAFPALSQVDGKWTPLMAWADCWSLESNIMLAIHHHQDTEHHGVLIAHIKDALANENVLRCHKGLSKMLMESSLSTKDILEIAGGRFEDYNLLAYPKRAIEIIKMRGFNGHQIDFERLKEEKFRGVYSMQVHRIMGEINFFRMAIVVGADDDFFIEKISKQHHDTLPAYILCTAVETGRSVELVDFLVERLEEPKQASFFPVNYHLPDQCISSFFEYDLLGLTFADKAMSDDFHESDYLRVAVRSMTPIALKDILYNTFYISNELVKVVFYDELIRQLHDVNKRAAFSTKNELVCKGPAFRFALSLQSAETLKELCGVAESDVLREAAQEALNNKF